jgi:type VI protein secretion system component Hcp
MQLILITIKHTSMKKDRLYQFVLLFFLCQFTAVLASAQGNRVIKVNIPGLPVFECLHAAGPSLAVKNLKSNNKRVETGTVTLVKNFDQYNEQLDRLAKGNKRFPLVVIEYYNKSSDGNLSKYGSINLSDAIISSVRLTEKKQTEIKFIYQKIEWTWTDGGVKATDDWDVATE